VRGGDGGGEGRGGRFSKGEQDGGRARFITFGVLTSLTG